MIDRDVIETIALVALFVISGGLCALIGYALGRMRGEDPPERLPFTHELLHEPAPQWRIEYHPPAVSPAPEPVTVSSPDVTVTWDSDGATAVSGAAVAVVDARGRR